MPGRGGPTYPWIMTFTKGGSYEGGRVKSHRGAAAGGGAGLAAIAGFLIWRFTGLDPTPVVEGLQGAAESGQTTTIEACSAEEANTQRDCRLSATIQSLDAYWAAMASAESVEFTEPSVTEFTGGVTTACGRATSSTGPFYCPADQGIYLDLGFFDTLETEYGGSGGSLAEMYVVAHEYGHHIQNITGQMDEIDREDKGADSDGVRLELQADCYSGMWTGDAATRVDPDTGVTFLEPITDEQLADALSAAAAVGDDHIQEQSGDEVDPDDWTHGSSEQRQKWFMVGYDEGTLAACDTFSAQNL